MMRDWPRWPILAKDPGRNPVMTRSYQYNSVGNITKKLTEHGNYSYQYDDLQRLTQAINPLIYDEVSFAKTSSILI